MIDAGEVARLSDDIVFLAAQIERAAEVVAAGVSSEGPLTASRIKELLGSSRKYVIPLLEHLDATGVTMRDGDVRSLRAGTVGR
jgi:selenocysteine-specific elongation factor